MIKEYKLNDEPISIESDLAGEYPLYIYLSRKKDCLLYSKSSKLLLESVKVIKPLTVSKKGISFLLQSAVVPPPQTVYENIFIVGIGQTARIGTVNSKIDIEFSEIHPFLNANRELDAEVDEEYILEILAEATVSRMEKNRENYLFHSAGKDSNSIALALSVAGYQNEITSVSYKGEGEKDESEIAKKIAKQFGFKHKIVYEPKVLAKKDIENINSFFENSSFPCMDNATLAYPLYMNQLDFSNSNIIDGMGNDVYIGHIPDSKEYAKQKNFSRFHHLRPFSGKFSSASRIGIATTTRTEWVGLSGLSYGDVNKILNDSFDVYDYWSEVDRENKNMDYLDLRSYIRGRVLDQEVFIRKVRNFADVTSSNLILPWTNPKVAAYFSKLPEKYLFDRKYLKNKLLLRTMLKDRIGLDSDKLGKKAYGFNAYGILMMMKKEVDQEILSCKLWNEKEVEELLSTLYKKIDVNHQSISRLKSIIQRLYLISVWYNQSKYV
jgi:asparagine synthase (glutamine-hydrolysing)